MENNARRVYKGSRALECIHIPQTWRFGGLIATWRYKSEFSNYLLFKLELFVIA